MVGSSQRIVRLRLFLLDLVSNFILHKRKSVLSALCVQSGRQMTHRSWSTDLLHVIHAHLDWNADRPLWHAL